jgi:hypothetical protein
VSFVVVFTFCMQRYAPAPETLWALTPISPSFSSARRRRRPHTQSAIFNFESLLMVLLLLICTCAYLRVIIAHALATPYHISHTLPSHTRLAASSQQPAASSQQPASSTATSEPCSGASTASTFEQGQCCGHGVHWELVGTPSMPTVGARCLCTLGTSLLSGLHSLQQGRAHRLCIDCLRWCMATMG